MRKTHFIARFFCACNLTPLKGFGIFALSLSVLGACRTSAEAPITLAPGCDYRGQSGICIHIDPNARSVNPAALEAAYLQAKRDAETLYHLNLDGVKGPTVWVMNVSDFARAHPINTRMDGDTGGHHGWTSFETGQIAITGPAVMRHESFHYLLWKAGYPNRLNSVHDHPAFDEYRDGQWLPKRASEPTPRPIAIKTNADQL